MKRVDTKYVKVDLESVATASNYLEKGRIQSVNINTDEKIVETVIVLN